MATTPNRRKAHVYEFLVRVGLANVPACSKRGRFYMGMAGLANRRILGGHVHHAKPRTLRSFQLALSCAWWDFFRQHVALPHLPEFPCAHHSAKACPYH